jgi:hypothetical protein
MQKNLALLFLRKAVYCDASGNPEQPDDRNILRAGIGLHGEEGGIARSTATS